MTQLPKDDSKSKERTSETPEVDGPQLAIHIEKKVETAVRGKCIVLGREIPFPGYIAEVKGREDWRVVLSRLDPNAPKWPIMVPSGQWERLIWSVPTIVRSYEPALAHLIQNRHIIFYDPPELYRNRMPLPLIKHALRGSGTQARRFWKFAIRDRDRASALRLLPEFERRFVEVQWEHAIWHKFQQFKRLSERETPGRKPTWPSKTEPIKPTSDPDLEDVWLSIDSEFISKVRESLDEASILPSSSFIPPMPMLKVSSGEQERKQVIRMNRAAAFLARQRNSVINWSGNRAPIAWPWFSIQVGSSCFGAGSERGNATGVENISEIVKTTFDTKAHIGVSLVIAHWDNLKADGPRKERLIWLAEDLVDFASSRGVSVILPRSGYYGMEMLDHGVSFFSSLLSGALKYPPRPGMSENEVDQFGKTAVYRMGDLSFSELDDYLAANGELPTIAGMPSRPSDAMRKDPRIFRTEFSKPMRIGTHTRELDEITKAINKGTRHPALRYLEDMGASGKRYY